MQNAGLKDAHHIYQDAAVRELGKTWGQGLCFRIRKNDKGMKQSPCPFVSVIPIKDLVLVRSLWKRMV